jgi:hypothetical protein
VIEPLPGVIEPAIDPGAPMMAIGQPLLRPSCRRRTRPGRHSGPRPAARQPRGGL